MKNLLLLISIVSFSAVLSAQNVEFKYDNGEAMPDTVIVSYSLDDPELEEHDNLSIYDASLVNNTSDNLRLHMKREIIEYVNDSVEVDVFGDGNFQWKSPSDQFCWGLCYFYGFNDSIAELGPADLAANATFAISNVVHYTHWGIPGTTTLKYSIINGTEVEDELVIKFELTEPAGTSIAENAVNFNVYPNPFNNYLSLANLENAKIIEINNILGQTVYQKSINTSSLELSTSGFEEGLYFVRIIDNNNEVYTERLIKR